MIYLDTGCLLKLYFPEPDSSLVVAAVSDQVVAYCALHRLELTTALEQKLGSKEARPSQVARTYALLEEDLAAGILHRPAVDWGVALSEANELSNKHTKRLGCRSLDILHCAIAAKLSVTTFITTDKRQRRLASAIGLSAPLL